ncbi:MAG TPA: PIN domain-containing protein [Bacteroidetes bacterium]|nr:PIN domain-containing protein [Bacteroidota bacterium]
MKYIIDTNILIYFLNDTLTSKGSDFLVKAFQNQEANISVITKIEILGFPFSDAASEIKATKLINSLSIFPLSNEIVNKTIGIRKFKKIKVADAIIAATAIINDLTLISRNEKDFKNLPGLNFINPFSL